MAAVNLMGGLTETNPKIEKRESGVRAAISLLSIQYS